MAVFPTYADYVDLNNDADFGDAGEDVSARVLVRNGVSIDRGRDQIQLLAPPAAGSSAFSLRNGSGDYDPGSNLKAGRRVRQTATFSAVTYNLFTGILETPRHRIQPPEPTVDVRALGTLSRLTRKTKLYTALYQNILISDALGYLFDAAEWPAADRVFDVAKTTLPWWWLDGEDAFSAALTLLYTEGPGAVLYEDGLGRAVFKNRHARLEESRSTTVQATYGNAGDLAMLIPPDYDLALEGVVNECVVTVKRRTAAALAAIWSVGETLTLGANEVRQLIARASGGDPFTAAVAPVLTTDYTVPAGSVSSITLDRTSGAQATITITAGASGATIAGLQMRAQLVPVTNTTLVANTTSMAASIAEHGLRTFGLPVREEISLLDAQNFCNLAVAWYGEGRPTIRFSAPANVSSADLISALSREVSDRIRVRLSPIAVDKELYIEQVRHQVTNGIHVTTFGCEEALEQVALWDSGLWDTALWGW